jgi:hypothetical protein
MSNSHPFSVQSWSDIYRMLFAAAERSRGTVTLTADGGPSITFPYTTSRDAFAIALVFDIAVDNHASAPLVARWIWESELLSGEPEDSTDTYVGNRSFWETLAAVADELDRVRAPLPVLSLIDNARRELETARPAAAQRMRNTAATLLVTVFEEPSWKAMAVRQLEFFCMLRGTTDRGTPFVLDVPRTCNADVLSLADYWTDQIARIGHAASDTFHRLVYSCWRETLHCVIRNAKHAPAHDTYAHNAEFWSALLLLTTQSDACDATPGPWVFHAPAPCTDRRNAGPADSGSTLDFPAAQSWDEAALIQNKALAELRGFDTIPGGLVTRIPRTTVGDVRQLAAYWQIILARVGGHHKNDHGAKAQLDRWKAAYDDVWRIPASAASNSVYAHNTEFWTALMTIAVHIGATDETPTPWQMFKGALSDAIHKLPERLLDPSGTITETITETITKAAQRGGDWLSGLLGKPLLYVGGGLAGLAIAVYLLRRPGTGNTESLP